MENKYYLLTVWPWHVVCMILVPQPGTEPGASAMEAPSPNNWPARGIPIYMKEFF